MSKSRTKRNVKAAADRAQARSEGKDVPVELEPIGPLNPPETEPTHKGGRPTTYDPALTPRAARQMSEAGATQGEIAKAFNVNVSTIKRWMHIHPAFREAMRVGGDAADDRVEAALFEKAIGRRRKVRKVFHYQGQITEHDVVEEIDGDFNAQRFWLMNRRRDRWTGGDAPSLTVNVDLGRDERAELARKMALQMAAAFGLDSEQRDMIDVTPRPDSEDD